MPNPELRPLIPLQLIPDSTGYWGAREIAKRMSWTTRNPHKPLVRAVETEAFPAFKRKRRDQRNLTAWYTEEWLIRRWMITKAELQRQNRVRCRQEQDEYKAKGLRAPRMPSNT